MKRIALQQIGVLWLAVAALLASGCKSTDHEGSGAEGAANAQANLLDANSGAKPGMVDCGKVPSPRVCCEALTPACNECRDQEQRQRASWRLQCLKPATPPQSCAGSPPVVDCCAEASDECRDCRDQALNQLLAWKQACADEEGVQCDRQPTLAACCDALIPSCDACRSRNRRITEAWQIRCSADPRAVHEVAKPESPTPGPTGEGF